MQQYISITGGGSSVDFKTAVLNGLAEDGGLYVPTQLPLFTLNELQAMKGLGYVDLAIEVLQKLIPVDFVSKSDLKRLVRKSFEPFFSEDVIPHHTLQSRNGLVVQELFHGPTLSFKDVAMGFVVNLFDFFLDADNRKMTIMVATSGDTGPAAAYASNGKQNLQTWLLYPEGMISEEQRRQMSCIISRNIHTVGVKNCLNGSDDLDAIISSLFSDRSFAAEVQLSSVNSINWARVMMQTVHYFYGYLQNVDEVGDPVNFSVPCGAFGNLCAGAIAKMMGLPIDKFIASSNANGVISKVIESGVLERRDIENTHASAIDIAVPMNFWRFLYFRLGQDPALIKELFNTYVTEGRVEFSGEQHQLIMQDFVAATVPDTQILNEMKEVYELEDYLLDPHGAVAVRGATLSNPGGNRTVCLATAHPSKFPDVVALALGKVPGQGRHFSIEENKRRAEQLIHVDMKDALDQIPDAVRALF